MVAYLDHAATTPLRPEALSEMLPFLTEHFGNPSGSHRVARRAKTAIEDARDRLASALGCRPGEVVFTSGGTEADNLAVAGRSGLGAVLCSAVEHHAVLHAVAALGGTTIRVDRSGVVDLDHLASLLTEGDVRVVSVMAANNETGVVQPLADVVDLVRSTRPEAAVHTDAVQAFAWLDVASVAERCDLVAISAHKFGGPKGAGALVVREGVELSPILHGGGQERERRSGTHHVAGIVGMAAAAEATVRDRVGAAATVRRLRDRLLDAVAGTIPGARQTLPAGTPSLPNMAHLLVDGVESEALLFLLDEAGVCASAGSACASGAVEPSHVLLAMGVDRASAGGAIRFSLGASTTEDDVDVAAKALAEAVARLRGGA